MSIKSSPASRATAALMIVVCCLQQAGCVESGDTEQSPASGAVTERPASQPSRAADDLVGKLQDAIAGCDANELAEVIGQVFRSRDASDSVQYLAEQWRLSLTQSGDTWSCMRRPLIRAHIANSLAQAYANGIGQGIDITSVGNALRDGLDSSDWVIAHLSIMGLDAIVEPSDFPKLEAVAKSDNRVKREDALRVLASQCSDEAGRILDDLGTRPGFESVPDIRKEMDFFRRARCQQAAQAPK